jgi:hypothetical protein
VSSSRTSSTYVRVDPCVSCADMCGQYWPSPLPFRGLIYISPVPYLDNSTLPLTDLAKALLPPLTVRRFPLNSLQWHPHVASFQETNDSAVALSSRTELATYFSVKGAAVDFATPVSQ